MTAATWRDSGRSAVGPTPTTPLPPSPVPPLPTRSVLRVRPRPTPPGTVAALAGAHEHARPLHSGKEALRRQEGAAGTHAASTAGHVGPPGLGRVTKGQPRPDCAAGRGGGPGSGRTDRPLPFQAAAPSDYRCPAPREMANPVRKQSEGRRTGCRPPAPWGRQTAAPPAARDARLCPARRRAGLVARGPCTAVPSLRRGAPRTPGRCCGNGQVTRLASEGIGDSPTLRRKVQRSPGDRQGPGLGTGHTLLKAGEQSSCLCCQRNF